MASKRIHLRLILVLKKRKQDIAIAANPIDIEVKGTQLAANVVEVLFEINMHIAPVIA